MRKIKKILTDVAGGLMILLSLLLGWLPGPAGIPLFLAGLSLLSINHDWAKRLLKTAKERGSRLAEMILDNNIWVKRVLDLLGVSAVGLSIWWYGNSVTTQGKIVGISYLIVGLFVLMFNRRRARKLLDKLKTKA